MQCGLKKQNHFPFFCISYSIYDTQYHRVLSILLKSSSLFEYETTELLPTLRQSASCKKADISAHKLNKNCRAINRIQPNHE